MEQPETHAPADGAAAEDWPVVADVKHSEPVTPEWLDAYGAGFNQGWDQGFAAGAHAHE